MPTQTAIDELEKELTRLKWTWHHPRVQTFIQEVAIRVKRPIAQPANASDNALTRLTKFLNIYWQCHNTMQILVIDWKDPHIAAVFQKYGYGDRLPMEGWESLLKILYKRWFESGGGF